MSAPPVIIEEIPRKLRKKLAEVLRPEEPVLLKIRGSFKEALVCTDTRVIILKSGFFASQFFGTNVFQLNYPSIQGVQVDFHLLSGYFEISTGGMQNREKRYWFVRGHRRDAASSPNSITLHRDTQAKFRNAATFILERCSALTGKTPAAAAPTDGPIEMIAKLAKLRDAGAITAAEFGEKKAKLLGQI
jgi:hypothetical protein